MSAVLTLLGGRAALANEGLYLPSAPTGPGGQDTIITPGGTSCSQSINSNGAYLDMGVAAYRSTGNNGYFGYVDQNDRPGGIVYSRVTIPLGERPRRLDCSRLYELELQRLRDEIELLRMGVQ